MARKKVERNISYDDQRKKYYVNFDFGIDSETGRQSKQTRTFSKLAEARAALRRHETERDRGQTVIPKELTLGQWLNDWMLSIVIPNLEATTVYGYQKIIDNHIIPAIGSIPLQKLTPQQVQRYYANKVHLGELSPNSVRKHHDLLSAALKMAVRQDLLSTNPIAKVMPPRKTQIEISYYSPEELKRLMHLVNNDRLEVVVKLAGYLGLRREEILGLTWNNIDFEQRLIYIRQARTAAGSSIVEKTPKNNTSSRTLHMTEDLYHVLSREKAKQAEYQDYFGTDYFGEGFVFAHENGRPFRPNYVSDLFSKFITDHGLPPITLHGLRHTFATVANSLGIPMYDIGKALGHSTPATTSRIYTHLLDQTHTGTLEKIAGALYIQKNEAPET